MKLYLCGLLCLAATSFGVEDQLVKPETTREFECYAQGAEARMQARPQFLVADSNATLNDRLVRLKQVQTLPGNGPNPHKVTGALLYDWVGSVLVPGVHIDRVIEMLQDYDHRAKYLSEMVASSKLLCRTGENRFGFTMRLKEPAVIDTDNDVVWERVDATRWRCRSYSTKVQEIGKQHRYLLRLNSYWRFQEVPEGVYVEGQTITLSGEFGSLTRSLGSLIGISPEKSLKKTLQQIRETVVNRDLRFEKPPAGLPACGEAPRRPACAAVTSDE